MGVKIETTTAALLADIHAELPAILLEYGEDQQEKIEDLMAEQKSGVHYKGQPRPSSAPGEAPAVQSGELQASVKAEATGELEVTVYSNDEKAEGLELGTKRILPRPAFTPVFHAAEQEFDKVMNEKVSRIVERHEI